MFIEKEETPMTFDEWWDSEWQNIYNVAIHGELKPKDFVNIGWNAALTNQWQPIETAPKDGTIISLFWPDYHQWGYRFPVVGYWAKLGFWCLKASGQGDPKSDPTHWMSIPKQPREKNNAS